MDRRVGDELTTCPCYHVCCGLGLEMLRWCRFDSRDLPPPGMYVFNPKDSWCRPGVQAAVLMLGYLLSHSGGDRETLDGLLSQVRQWTAEQRPTSPPTGMV